MDLLSKKYKQAEEISNLKAENNNLKYKLYVTLKEKDRWNSKCNTFYNACKKQLKTLQEIKAIATIAFAVCDDDCGNANRFTEILDLITKAERNNV